MKVKLIFIFLFPFLGFASSQIPELLIYKNDTIPIYNLIIEKYPSENKTNILGESQGQLFGLEFRGGSFNCWRGYQGVYKIENDSLFVVGMKPISGILDFEGSETGREIGENELLKNVFGSKLINGKIFVDWFSGNINIKNGDLMRWDGVFVRTFENEKSFLIKKGRIKDVFNAQNYIDLPNGINRRFDDNISDEIFKELGKIKWKNLHEYDCSENYEFTIGKNGKIREVQMAQYKSKEEIKEFWDRKEYNYCMKTIKNAVRNMQFDLIKSSGKNIEETVWLEIWVNEDGSTENRND